MYLTDPHALPAYSIFLHNVTLLLPDESPMAKLKNKSGAKLLAEDPLQLYNKLMLLQTHRPDYIVLQEKYAFSDGRLRPEYSFLLASYALRSVNRNANIW